MNSYFSLAVLIKILATLPVTTATNEHSFSALKYLKTYLLNATKEVRLTGFAMLYVYCDISLGFEQVIAELLKVGLGTIALRLTSTTLSHESRGQIELTIQN